VISAPAVEQFNVGPTGQGADLVRLCADCIRADRVQSGAEDALVDMRFERTW